MAALPYMQFYVADYLADTAHLTTEEHGAYLLLLFSYWQTGKPLKADRLASIARMSNERWTNVEQTLSEFFHVSKGTWTHFRVEADLEKVNTKSRNNSEAGKASARARALAKQALADSYSTNVATNAERSFNHARSRDTDTDTDTEQNQKPLSFAEEPDPVLRKRDETPYADFLATYQRVCAGRLKPAEKLNDKRRIAIRRAWNFRARGKYPFRESGFLERYLERLCSDPFKVGENPRGWRADIEYAFREKTMTDVLGV